MIHHASNTEKAEEVGLVKIRKINEDKVQIIITNQDLEERDFKKWELIPLSSKAQELFQDLLDMAYQECGFEIGDDSQLMVEAYPLTVDSFVVIMTRVRGNYGCEHFNIMFPQNHETEEDNEGITIERGAKQVWNFADLEICSQACARINPEHIESSTLYKYEDEYYLSLSINTNFQSEVTALLGEYGEWVPYDETFFKEYGKTSIASTAVPNLGSLIK